MIIITITTPNKSLSLLKFPTRFSLERERMRFNCSSSKEAGGKGIRRMMNWNDIQCNAKP